MSVDKRTSIIVVNAEIEECEIDARAFGWEISRINEAKLNFTVSMRSPVDQEEYIVEVQFDNYREWPLFLEFIHPKTYERGVKNAYPKPGKKGGSFFHSKPCICNPCSRKAYKMFGGPHADWGHVAGWAKNPKIGDLINLRGILNAIYCRIRNPDFYGGRQNG